MKRKMDRIQGAVMVVMFMFLFAGVRALAGDKEYVTALQKCAQRGYFIDCPYEIICKEDCEKRGLQFYKKESFHCWCTEGGGRVCAYDENTPVQAFQSNPGRMIW